MLQNYRRLTRTSSHIGCFGLRVRANYGTGDQPPPDVSDEENTKSNKVKKENMQPAAELAKGSFSFLSKLQTAETTLPSVPSIDDIKSDNLQQLRTVLSEIKTPRTKPIPTSPPTTKSAGFNYKFKVKNISINKISLSSEGPRLGIFNKSAPDDPVSSPGKWRFFKEEEDKKAEAIMIFRESNMFEKMMDESKYEWNYPIDNEQGRTPEEEVGFEEHVFLDHHLKDFQKGPIRHFMELVVAGLSKNPHYTVAEKREHIEWYKTYFKKFPQDELSYTE